MLPVMPRMVNWCTTTFCQPFTTKEGLIPTFLKLSNPIMQSQSHGNSIKSCKNSFKPVQFWAKIHQETLSLDHIEKPSSKRMEHPVQFQRNKNYWSSSTTSNAQEDKEGWLDKPPKFADSAIGRTSLYQFLLFKSSCRIISRGKYGDGNNNPLCYQRFLSS